jgi:hypothetical protein
MTEFYLVAVKAAKVKKDSGVTRIKETYEFVVEKETVNHAFSLLNLQLQDSKL